MMIRCDWIRWAGCPALGHPQKFDWKKYQDSILRLDMMSNGKAGFSLL